MISAVEQQENSIAIRVLRQQLEKLDAKRLAILSTIEDLESRQNGKVPKTEESVHDSTNISPNSFNEPANDDSPTSNVINAALAISTEKNGRKFEIAEVLEFLERKGFKFEGTTNPATRVSAILGREAAIKTRKPRFEKAGRGKFRITT